MKNKQTIRTIDIARGSTHDGPGMRTTVFVKGCSLNCRWCQNPESINYNQDIWWEETKCIGCMSCIKACNDDAIYSDETGIHINREKCTLCERCVSSCPTHALQLVGKQWTMDSLLKEVLKDKHYYDEFGGGVTVSGGEPLMYASFLEEFFKSLKSQGVSTALDTCGYAPKSSVLKVMPYVDVVLFDIKLIDPIKHKEFTEADNNLTLENLLEIASYIRKVRDEEGRNIKLWIRTPLIPEATATSENISKIASFIIKNLSDVFDRWDMCAFNTSCISKYNKLDKKWHYEDYSLLREEFAEELKQVALDKGIDKDKLSVTGIMSTKK